MIHPVDELVVDSSVAAMWVLPEPGFEKAQDLLADPGRRLFVLDLAYIEVANAIWKRVHRGRMSHDQADMLLREFMGLDLMSVSSRSLLQRATSIATRYDRSVYDALFVALAEKTDVLAVTADQPLYNAVHRDFPNIRLLGNL